MLLPQDDIEHFVRPYFARKDTFLRLRDTEDTPLYVFEQDVLVERAGQFRHAFLDRFPGGRFYFAVKSNNHPAVAETAMEAGFGLDVSSGMELRMALDLGAEDLLFTGPGKTGRELALAVDNSAKVLILIDSFHELQVLEEIAAGRRTSVRAGVRLSTDSSGLWRKFGIPRNELRTFFRKAERCPHVELQGLQFHTSWNLSPKAQTDFISLLGAELATYPPHLLKKIRFIDVGGGYWPESGEWVHGDSPQPAPSPPLHVRNPAAPLESFAAALHDAIETHLAFLLPCRIYFEPGRWICNDSMHLLMSVVDIKAPDLVITDGGIQAIGWERFETDYFPVLNLSRPSLTEKACHICGSLCTPRDILGYAYFGRDIRIGDLLLIPCQGAYTYSLKQGLHQARAKSRRAAPGNNGFMTADLPQGGYP